MLIAEPTTTITDFVLGLEALWFGVLLMRSGGRGRRARHYLGVALVMTGVGALTGGVSHGFAPWLEGTIVAVLLWKVTLLCIGLTSLFFLWSAAAAALSAGAGGWLRGAAIVQFAIYVGWILGHDAFIWAIADYVPAMLVALLLFGREYGRGRAGAGWIVAGILITFAGAAVQASGFALHRHFNHNDLFHVIQMVAVYVFYRGGGLLDDLAAPPGVVFPGAAEREA